MNENNKIYYIQCQQKQRFCKCGFLTKKKCVNTTRLTDDTVKRMFISERNF